MHHVANPLFVHQRLVVFGLLVLFNVVAATPAAAQDPGQSSIPAPSPTPQPTPIPASAIPSRAADAADAARQAVAKAAPDARLQQIQQSLPAEKARIQELRETTLKQLKTPGPASMITESEKAWGREKDRLERWLVDLAARSGALDGVLDDLKQRTSLWQLTREHQPGAKLPEALVQQISGAIKNLSDAENGVRSARDAILNLQAGIAREKSIVDEMLAEQQVEIGKRAKGVFAVDSPPLWKAFGASDEAGDAHKQFVALQHEHWRSLKGYVAEQWGQLLVWVLMWPALTVLMVYMHRKAEVWARQDRSLGTAVTVFSRPAAAALVVTAFLDSIMQPRAPSAWTNIVGLLLVLAALRVLPPLLPTSMRRISNFVVLLFVLRRAVELMPQGYGLYRLALITLALGGCGASVWLIRVLRADSDSLSKKWHTAVLAGAQVALVLFLIGLIADIIGSVGFSALVVMGTAYAMLAAVLMVALSVALRSIVRVGLLTAWARRIGIAPDHSDAVRTTLFKAISFVTLIGWAIVSLRSFLLLDPLLASIHRALDWSVTIGSFSIDPGDYLIFAFTIWLSFRAATFVQFVLNVDVMPRVDLPRGVPETISRLTRYVVIAVGAVIASAAAGFDISKVTIIVGALGVGVGFGLQNIVNNFVSGLILLFERPIRVGDTLDIDDTGGVVEKIGMRASIVATWDGAEVIVPNSNLISQDVTNWTLTQDRRRMVIPVGVSYGCDPEKAAQLIVEAANEHESVDAKPAPSCLFVGFGDSSLDFQLRAWTAGSAYMGVASDLRFAIVKKLDEAGIEIPFPQRDLYLRTADPEAASLAGLQQNPDVPAEDGDVGTKSTGGSANPEVVSD